MRNQRGRLFAGALLAMAFLPGFDCGSPSGGGADAGMTGATGCVGGCPGGQTCVAGHAGAICVADCASSIDCPATCCVMTQQGAHVCAPDSTYCTTRPPAGGCSPACPNGYECVTAQGAAVCLANCASDGDCPNTCCVGVTNGTRVCAPTRSSCATPSSCSPACPNGYQCIAYNGGFVCAQDCTADSQCPQTCCASAQNGASVCAPDTTLCPAQSPCSPACQSGYDCVSFSGAYQCALRCSTNTDCPATCCVAATNGDMVCAPDTTSCPTMPPPTCTPTPEVPGSTSASGVTYPSNCCSGQTNAGGACCQAAGQWCTNQGDCCEGSCANMNGQLTCVSGCILDGQAVAATNAGCASCCSGKCYYSQATFTTAYCYANCNQGGPCTANYDCCFPLYCAGGQCGAMQ